MKTLFDVLSANRYPGRGIFMGVAGGPRVGDAVSRGSPSGDGSNGGAGAGEGGAGGVGGIGEAGGKYAVIAYFIMGRSENSRNRVFVEDGEGIRTKAFDESKMTDPSLIIYSPVRVLGSKTIVTNGDQTDTVYDGLDRQMTFEAALRSRTFEPDAPNYTPRISAVMRVTGGGVNYALSIIKRPASGGVCRAMFAYESPAAGEGRLIHTYMGDASAVGGALPSFEGEPALVSIADCGIDDFTSNMWQALDGGNKVALWVRYIELATGRADSRIVNKNKVVE